MLTNPAAVPDTLLQTLLHVSLTGVILFRPVFSPDDPATVVDLVYAQLNPAAQRMLRLPECPAESLLTLYPSAVEMGIFAFYRDTFLDGRPGRHDVNYQHDGLDNYYQLAAQRHGELLVVSFSDTADQPRTAVETALRQSQAREQQARAEAELQRQHFYEVLMALPAQVATYHGPDHIYQFVNEAYQRYFPTQALPGRSLREVLPETEAQGVLAVMDRVYQTGEPSYLQELEVWLDFSGSGQPRQLFLNVLFHPLRDAQGRVDGLLDFSYDVTEQVLARREAEQLSQELEARVFERTQALRHAQAESVVAAQRLLRITESLPSTSFTVDQTGEVLYISPQWYTYTGMAPGVSINEVWPSLIHPDDLPAIAQEFGAALAAGRPWGYEFRLRGADGAYRWFASQGQPEPLAEAEAAGRSRQWFGSNLDIDDLKQAQQAREQQQQLLTTILTSLPAGVATFEGEALRYTFFNDNYQQIARGRAERGRLFTELFPEAEEQDYPDLLRQVLRTAEPYRAAEHPAYVYDPRTGERHELFLDLTYLPLRHGTEAPYAVLAFSLDVTERVRARQRAETMQAELLAAAQRQAQERAAFYEVFEQTTALVVLLRGPQHRIEYHNAAYQQLFPGRQLLGRTVAEMAPEAERQGFVALLDRVYTTGETHFGVEMPFVVETPGWPPSEVRYFNFTFQRFEENGQPAGISEFAYDVTEQVRARQEREAQRQQLAELFMQAPAPIVILDGPELVFQLVNPAYQQIFPGRELVGKPLLTALPELAGTPIPALFEQVYQTGETYSDQELPLEMARSEGAPLETIYWTFTYQARRDAHGAVDGVRVFAHDVTAPVRARQQALASSQQVLALNAELTATNAQLTRTNADLDTFVYTASHDLRTPMTNIEGLLLALQQELPPEARQVGAVQPMLDMMQGAVERFRLTLDQLTDVARLQQAPDQPAEAVDLAALVAGLRLDLAPLLASTHARLTLDVAGCPQVSFAPAPLRSIVYNLLSNAVKYHHPDRPPQVRLRCRTAAAGVVLEVEDNGLGLTPAQQGQLFGLFRRLHDHVEGTGVGLYAVKRLVENAGGTISVRSEAGLGSTFTVTLPRAARNGEPAPK